MEKQKNFSDWIKTANYINLTLTIDSFIIEDFIRDVIKLSGLTKRLDLAEEALLCILANLYNNHLQNKPTIIPGARKEWWKFKTYCNIEWATLDRVSALLNTLLKMNYINKIAGVYTEKDKYIAKYWLKDDCPIIGIFSEGQSPVQKKELPSSILVRDKSGALLNWTSLKCDKRKTKQMITNIDRYNKLLKQHNITFKISSAEIESSNNNIFKISKVLQGFVNTNSIELNINNNRINKIYSIENNSNIIILDTKYYNYIVDSNSSIIIYSKYRARISSIYSKYYKSIYSDSIYSIYSSSTQCYYLSYELGRYAFVKSCIPNNDAAFSYFQKCMFFDTYVLSGCINYTKQVRIFNRGSMKLGGRFYGGAWNSLPKIIRNNFLIDGEPVQNLDFDGIHLRMLYHKIHKQFTGESYVYPKTDNNPDRDRMKLITLILINAKNQREGVYAINRRFKKKGLFVSNYYTNKLIKQFKEYHKTIKKYFFNDVGVKLQNIDSTIMYNILNKLTRSKIPVISVHDEVIFTTKHKVVVEECMLEEYQKEVGFTTSVS